MIKTFAGYNLSEVIDREIPTVTSPISYLFTDIGEGYSIEWSFKKFNSNDSYAELANKTRNACWKMASLKTVTDVAIACYERRRSHWAEMITQFSQEFGRLRSPRMVATQIEMGRMLRIRHDYGYSSQHVTVLPGKTRNVENVLFGTPRDRAYESLSWLLNADIRCLPPSSGIITLEFKKNNHVDNMCTILPDGRSENTTLGVFAVRRL